MSVAESIEVIKPLQGKVVPIRTIYQTQPPEVVFNDVWVVEINVKATSKVIHILNNKYPRHRDYPLNHLKRFAKRETLPAAFRDTLPKPKPCGRGKSIPTLFGFIAPPTPDEPLPDADEIKELLAPFAPDTYGTKNEPCPSNIALYKTRIPFQPPFTERQSQKWAQTIWPMSWNPAVPKSTAVPPPMLLDNAQQSIQRLSGYYLALAQKVAEAGKASGRGRGVGAVIVDPRLKEEIDEDAWLRGEEPVIRWMNNVVAVAEDARYARSEGGQPSQTDLHPDKSPNPACMELDPDQEGGPDLHALMRAVELVALCRRSHGDDATQKAAAHSDLVAVHTDSQLTSSEQLSTLEAYFIDKELTAPIPSTKHQPSTTPSDEQEPAPSPKKKRKKNRRTHRGKRAASRSVSPELAKKAPATQDQDDTATSPLSATSPSVDSLSSPPPNFSATSPSADSLSSPPPNMKNLPTGAILSGRADGGYLCAHLDVYLSHEPCWTCSMGICLSRFRAVIFPRSGRMKTGGLSTEPIGSWEDDSDEEECHKKPLKDVREKYYGLHYREELNWRALGFEFIEDEEKPIPPAWDNDVEFHA